MDTIWINDSNKAFSKDLKMIIDGKIGPVCAKILSHNPEETFSESVR